MVHVVVITSTAEDEVWDLDNEEGKELDVSRKIPVEDAGSDAEPEASDRVEDNPAATSDGVMYMGEGADCAFNESGCEVADESEPEVTL